MIRIIIEALLILLLFLTSFIIFKDSKRIKYNFNPKIINLEKFDILIMNFICDDECIDYLYNMNYEDTLHIKYAYNICTEDLYKIIHNNGYFELQYVDYD